MVVGKKVGDHSKGGIGGFVKFFNGCNILEFAGPSIANSALQAEKQALLQMVDLLANSQWSSERILILSDNKQLLALVNNQQFNLEWENTKAKIF